MSSARPARSRGRCSRLEFLIDTDLPDSEASIAQFRLWLEYWARAIHDPRLALVHSERHSFERGVIEEIIAEGIASGEFVATDASAVAAEFLGLLEGLGLQVCLGDVQMPVESARRLLRNLPARAACWRRLLDAGRARLIDYESYNCAIERLMMPGSGTPDLRSRRWFDGFDLHGYSHRGWLRHNGFSDEALRGRPVIGICNMWSELVGCNVHLRGLATAVKRGVLQAGGLPLEFPVMTPGDALQKPAAMMYRNLASMDVEETIRSNPLDAVVLLAGCDKSGPAALMGAASADVPCIMVTGGPAQPGYFRGKRVGSGSGYWKFADAARLGDLTPEEYLEAEASTNRTHGPLHGHGHGLDDGVHERGAWHDPARAARRHPRSMCAAPCSPSGAGAVRSSWRTRACGRAASSRARRSRTPSACSRRWPARPTR